MSGEQGAAQSVDIEPLADDLFAGGGGWDVGAAALGIHARGVEIMQEARAHGGASPQALSAAEVRRQVREALLAAESFGLPREVDPHTALLEELHRTAGAVEWLGAIVADLDTGAVAWGRIREKIGGEDAGTTIEARPNAFVSLWQAERKHLVEVSRACISAGIEERRVRVAESAGQQLASVVRAVLDRLGLSDEQRVLALSVVPEEFRRLSGDVVAGEVLG